MRDFSFGGVRIPRRKKLSISGGKREQKMRRETIYWNKPNEETNEDSENRDFEVIFNGKTFWIREYNGDKYELCNGNLELIESFDTYPEAQSAAETLARKKK